jgi:hypothetical protein
MRTLRSFVGVAVTALLLTFSALPAQASRTLLHIEIADAHVMADSSVKVRLFYSCPGGSDLGVEGNASLWVFQLRDGIFIRSATADSLFDSMTCDGTNRLLVQTFRRDIDGRRFIADLSLNVSASFNLDIPDLEEALSREEKTFPPGGGGPLVDQDILVARRVDDASAVRVRLRVTCVEAVPNIELIEVRQPGRGLDGLARLRNVTCDGAPHEVTKVVRAADPAGTFSARLPIIVLVITENRTMSFV